MKKLGIKFCPLFVPLGIVLATEVLLRTILGLGNPLLMKNDTNIGYLAKPNQKIFRFGKHIKYNQYSQRSEPITLEKPANKLRILMIGDSVLNGGNPIDQSQTITELLKNKLLSLGYSAEILNASAGSWGIGNRIEYLREFGTFHSDAIIVQIGTHDLNQPTSTSEIVGEHPHYPTHKPLLAILELWDRYIEPKLSAQFNFKTSPAETLQPSPKEMDRLFQENMVFLQDIVLMAKANHIPVFVLFTANRDDLVPKFQVPHYKAKFLDILSNLNVPIIDSHESWSVLPKDSVMGYYRDFVHLTETGNQSLANLLFEELCLTSRLFTCSSK